MENIRFTDPAECQQAYEEVRAAAMVEAPSYNKHRDGPWPSTDAQRAYVKTQTARYDENLIRLYQGWQVKMARRWAELGNDWEKAKAEAGPEVFQQANILFYDRIWIKEGPRRMNRSYLFEIYRYWRDISHAPIRKQFDRLWEYVAEKRLPVKRMTVPGEYQPDPRLSRPLNPKRPMGTRPERKSKSKPEPKPEPELEWRTEPGPDTKDDLIDLWGLWK